MGTRYGADQNKVLGIFESGAYGSEMATGGSTFWIGQVTDHSVDDGEGLIEGRYMGTATRSFDAFDQGPQDVTGTLTFHPVDMRLPFWAIGSTIEHSGTAMADNYEHAVSEVDSDVCQNTFVSGTGQDMTVPMCFSIEDSKQAVGTGRNFVRTIAGNVLDTVKITASQGEKVTVDVDYIGQSLAYGSGTTTTIVDSGTKPYMWSDCTLVVAGSPMDTAKEFSLAVNNNMQAEHYIGSSALGRFHGRVIAPPVAGNRDYTLSITMDLPSDDASWLYHEKYKGGSTFNASFDLDNDTMGQVGSKHTTFIMSGCQILSMDNPSVLEGLNETTLEIRPQNVTGSAWDTISNYNPW